MRAKEASEPEWEKEMMKGKKKTLSAEHKKKLSDAFRGRKHSDETRQKISDANRGRKHSDETKRKISESKRGMKQSEETKKKRRLSMSSLLWFNNGKQNVRTKECPGPEWKRGMMKRVDVYNPPK